MKQYIPFGRFFGYGISSLKTSLNTYNRFNLGNGEIIKIGWNYVDCGLGFLEMSNDPIFISGTSTSKYNVSDLISWQMVSCGSATIGKITIIAIPDDIDIFEITIGPYHTMQIPFIPYYFYIDCNVDFNCNVSGHIYRTDKYDYYVYIDQAVDGQPSSRRVSLTPY